MNLSIVIAVNKKDLWFCRICIASVRYYYPDIPILLLKDEINGSFSTKELEKFWGVKIFDLKARNFGWGASKTFFLLDAPQKHKYLVLDSDIIFISPFLERLQACYENYDIVVSADYITDPNLPWIKNIYFEVKRLIAEDGRYEFPGYFFNTGQIFITGGAISDNDFVGYFSRDYPYWLKPDLLPLVDQSLYNYIFPKLELSKKISIAKENFMIWSESKEAKQIFFDDVKDKKLQFGLIHWAGAIRHPKLRSMKRSDLLVFFEHYYYSQISFSYIKRKYRRYAFGLSLISTKIRLKIKSLFLWLFN